MSGAVGAVVFDAVETASLAVVDDLVLARASVENGVTRAELMRDLAPIMSHRLSPSELRAAINQSVLSLVGSRLCESRGRFRLQPAGHQHLTGWLGKRKLPSEWSAIRDVRLIATTLGLAPEPMILKAIGRPDGVRAAVLQRSYGVRGKKLLGSSRLRMALAVVALERAFGNKIKSGLDAGRGLSVKASRLLAGQLARRPRDFGTDTRLIAALAAEAVGARQNDAASLRLAILRRYVSDRLGDNRPAAPVMKVAPANDAPRLTVPEPPATARPAAANRPDLKGFVRAVMVQADEVADGWPGNRKAYISRVWSVVADAHPEWGLSAIEFKSMLVETHRTGHIVLGSADIKSKDNLKDVQDSAVAYKNTVWHFIRVEN